MSHFVDTVHSSQKSVLWACRGNQVCHDLWSTFCSCKVCFPCLVFWGLGQVTEYTVIDGTNTKGHNVSGSKHVSRPAGSVCYHCNVFISKLIKLLKREWQLNQRGVVAL